MTVLLQVSDAHFGTERPEVVAALLGLAQSQQPDVVVLSGDITQRARRSQFAAARAFVDRLPPTRLLAIAGNHDIPLFNALARIFAPYANYARAFGPDLEPVLELGDMLVIGVNTTRPRRHKDGEISELQVQRVGARLLSAKDHQLRIVVVHQPVLAIQEGDTRNLIHGRERAIDAWVDSGVDIVMGGHIHLPYVRPLHALGAHRPRTAWTVQAGTAVSSRVRDGLPNSVNVIRCVSGTGPRGCIVERWDFASGSNCFEQHASQSLQFAS